MLTILFGILFLMVFGKLFVFSMKAAWGITKIIVTIVLLPLTLLFMVIGGLIHLALPILLIVGVFSLLQTA